MTAPPLKQPQLNCAGKNRYPDEYAARAVGMYAINTYKNPPRLYVYQCPHCSGWHLTKSRNTERPAISRHDPLEAHA